MDAWRNLAVEEYLIDQVSIYDRILFLWQCHDTVVIGKNQNPWGECNLRALRADGGKLARRLSGGGAVFHDAGNLNYSYILPRDHFSADHTFAQVLEALKQVGLQADRTDRNCLVVEGRKISGNAFCFRRNAALHHGTLLVHADLAKMDRYLDPSLPAIQTRAVRSVGASVANLRSWKPRLTCARLADELAFVFRNVSGRRERTAETVLNEHEISRLTLKYGSWDWLYGESPDFEITLGNRFANVDITFSLVVQKGLIQRIHVPMHMEKAVWLQSLPELLIGCRFEAGALAARLRGLGVPATLRDQLITWILSLGI